MNFSRFLSDVFLMFDINVKCQLDFIMYYCLICLRDTLMNAPKEYVIRTQMHI